MEIKVCSKCNEAKAYKNFPTHKGRKDGFGEICKQCKTNYDKIYYINNREKRIASAKKRYEENRDAIRKYFKENYQKNRVYYLQKGKERRLANPDKIKAINKLSRAKYKKTDKGKHANSKLQKLYCKNLTKSYVARLVTRRSDLSSSDVSDEFIDTYRELLKLKREIKKHV